MASGSKFELSSGSPDGLMYPNGQRGSYLLAPGDKSTRYRETVESRVSVIPGMPRNNTSSHCDMMNILQSVQSDSRAADNKPSCQGEFKRALVSALGISEDDSSSISLSGKGLPPSTLNELKKVRDKVHECSIKSRIQAKTMNDAISKIDKQFPGFHQRKRSRSDLLSSERSNSLLPDSIQLGGNINKMCSDSHILNSSAYEPGSQKPEERVKSSVPNKRVRTSMVDVRMDVRPNGLTRPLGLMDREKDTLRLGNGIVSQLEEKNRILTTSEGWKKSKRKKRSGIKSDVSASATLARPIDCDRETKRGVQQRLGSESRSRLNDTHAFRSGSSNGSVGVGKVELTSQQNVLGIRSTARTDQDCCPLPNDRRDRSILSDKERITHKANKPHIRDDNCAGSPTSIPKMNAPARAPRSSSGALHKSSSNARRALATPDWENSNCSTRPPSTLVDSNRKRSAALRSSSPGWAGQRPQKTTRIARRTNFVPIGSTHDEVSTSDGIGNVGNSDISMVFPRRMSSNAIQQVKIKGDHLLSVGQSENEDSGAVDVRPKEKRRKSGEEEETAGPSGQKATTLVLSSRKNKVVADEEVGDGVRRQGRTGRGFGPRSTLPPTLEKFDNTATVKQLRSIRLGSDKTESKAGRPPTKKLSERKAYTRPRHAINGLSEVSVSGESDNDHEPLLAAAEAVLSTRKACAGEASKFWNSIEPAFAYISNEDITFLKEQLRVLDESAKNTRVRSNNDSNLKCDLVYECLPSTAPVLSKDDGGTIPNGILVNDCMSRKEHFSGIKIGDSQVENVVPDIEVQRGIPLSLRMIAAVIQIDEIEEKHCMGPVEDFKNDSRPFQLDLDARLNSQSLNRELFEDLRIAAGTTNDYKVTASHCHDEQEHELDFDFMKFNHRTGPASDFTYALNGVRPNQSVVSSAACSEAQYEEMGIEERILLELQSIGISPENLGEHDEISDAINELEEKLHVEVAKKKNALLKLEKAATEAKEVQERKMENLALDELVTLAYKKYMKFQRGKIPVNRFSKRGVFASIKSTLERCRTFEVTGKNCFSESKFSEMFHSVPSYNCNIMPANVEASVDSDNSDQKTDSRAKDSDTTKLFNHSSQQTSSKEETWSNRVKRRELSLDDVGNAPCSSPKSLPGIPSPFVNGGTKGKRSERDRDGKAHNRDGPLRNSTAKIGRPASSNIKGERKSKAKPRQKTTQLSASVTGLHGRALESPKEELPLVPLSSDSKHDGNNKEKDRPVHPSAKDASNDPEAFDLSHLQLPGMELLGAPDDLDGQGQDIAAWLNIDEEFQDNDFMGLAIPMDDLADLNMNFQT